MKPEIPRILFSRGSIFLAITASNLDEFYIVRVASLRDMQSVGLEAKDIAGFTTSEQLARIDEKTRRTMALMYTTFGRSLVTSLEQERIYYRNYEELTDREKAEADIYFKTFLYPILTPMAVDASRPFPLIYNRMLNMCVMLENDADSVRLHDKANDGIKTQKKSGDEDKYVYATIQIPNVVRRLYQISTEDSDVLFR